MQVSLNVVVEALTEEILTETRNPQGTSLLLEDFL